MVIRTAEILPLEHPRDLALRNEPAYASVDRKAGVIGNGFMEVRLDLNPSSRHQAVFLNKITGEAIDLHFHPFTAQFDWGELSGAQGKAGAFEARGSSHVASVSAPIHFEHFDAEVNFVLARGQHVLQKRVTFRNISKPMLLQRVSLFSHTIDPACEAVLHEAGMYAPVVFLRSKASGVFYCIDFPCYFCHFGSQAFRFDYYPGRALEPGRSYQSLTAFTGMVVHTGRFRQTPYHEDGAELDTGERLWFRAAMDEGGASSPLPTLELRGPEPGTDGPDDIEQLGLCESFGITRALLPRLLRSVGSCPQRQAVHEAALHAGVDLKFMLRRGRDEDIHYMPTGDEGDVDAPEVGTPFALDSFRDLMVDHFLSLMERHGFSDVEVTGAPVVPYFNPRQGIPGLVEQRALLHQAFQGLVDVVAALREHFGHVSTSGPYSCYGTGMARLFDAVSLLQEDHPLALPDLHPARLYADMNRLYFRRSHDYLLPKGRLVNSVGLPQGGASDDAYPGSGAYPWFHYHDREGWRYALISAIATGLRHRFHPLPREMDDADRAFARRWLDWECDHLNELREVETILDEPGLGTVDGYSYAGPKGAFVFLFNNGWNPAPVTLRLGLTHDSEYLVRELYPRDMNYLGPEDGLYRRDSEVTLELDPREARIIEAVRRSPAAARRKRPELFGAEAEETPGGVTLFGRPGRRVDAGIRHHGVFTRREIRFPGQIVPDRILEWTLATRPLEEGRSSLARGEFPGHPVQSETGTVRDAWLCARVTLPSELSEHIDTRPFSLERPVWAYPKRLFFLVRIEPEPLFDPIRTISGQQGIPEGHDARQAVKCGIDLAPLNIGLKAWINGTPCAVYPAVAAWDRYAPNPRPVTGWFFEAGSKLTFGERSHVALYMRRLPVAAFRGVIMAHLPELKARKTVELP